MEWAHGMPRALNRARSKRKKKINPEHAFATLQREKALIHVEQHEVVRTSSDIRTTTQSPDK